MLFLDTNVLLRLFDAAAPEHGTVRRAVETLEARGEALVIGLQVLVEAWVVATRPVERNGLGWPVWAAKTLVEAARSRFGVLVEDEATADRWTKIVVIGAVSGKHAHDARIVALMASHGVSRILALNGGHFVGIAGTVVVEPQTVAD